MWTLYDKAKRSGKLPSECVPGLAERVCDWTIYQFDNAVIFFGTAIENAAQEQTRIQYGNRSEYRPKYTLDQLLSDGFRLPRPQHQGSQTGNGLAPILALAGKPGSRVKRFAYVGPMPGQAQ